MNIKTFAESLVDAGLSVIPCKADKSPLIGALPFKLDNGERIPARDKSGNLRIDNNGEPVYERSWELFKTRIPASGEIRDMFRHAKGIGIIGGRVSGQLFQLDFEGKDHDHKPIPPVFEQWREIAKAALKDAGIAGEKLSICQTPSGGYHVRGRVQTDETLPNLSELAAQFAVDETTGEILTDARGKAIVNKLIEAKNEGGYCCAPPTDGYVELEGSLLNLPTVSMETYQILIDAAKSLHSAILPDEASVVTPSADRKPLPTDGLSPGDDFNQRGDLPALLTKNNWTLAFTKGVVEYWKRPGTDKPCSATWNFIPDRFYSFSSNAMPFEERKTYHKFAVYALLEHDGDFSAAAKALATAGYGNPSSNAKPIKVASLTQKKPLPLVKPLSFPREGFRGIFEVYRQAMEGRNEVCDAYHFANLKSVVGAVLGRTGYLYTGMPTYPNFYSCLVGPTGLSRKTTGLRIARDVLQRAEPLVQSLGGLATPEGLIAALQIPNPDDEENPLDEITQARVMACSQEEGFRAFIGLSEFAALLKKAKKVSSDGLIQTLTDAYDCPPFLDNPTRHSPLRAFKPCVSITALSTQDWLEASLNLEDIRGGFANRFCYYLHELTPPVPEPQSPDAVLINGVIEIIHGVRQFFQGKHIEFRFDEETREFVNAWYIKNRESMISEPNELVRDTMQRLDTNARKLALVFAMLENAEGDFAIHLDQFQAALSVASYWRDAMQRIFGSFATDTQAKNETRILEKIREKPDATKREIQRSFGRHLSAKDFNSAVEELVKAGVIGIVEHDRKSYLQVITE